MADIVLRIKADDQVSKVLDGIKRKAGEALSAGGPGRASSGLGSSLAIGGAAGAVGGGVMALGSIMKEAFTKLIDIGMKMWKLTVDSSPMLQGVLKVLKIGFDNVLRPIGDTIAMLLMPAVISFTRESATAYATFAAALKGAAPGEIPGILSAAMTEQMRILGNFITTLIPVITQVVDAVLPAISEALPKFIDATMPIVLTTITDWMPRILEALTKGVVESQILSGRTPGTGETAGLNPAPISGYNQLGQSFYGGGWNTSGLSTIARYFPGHAAGGIFTRPHFARIAEAGPEAVVPLSRGGGIGGGLTMNFYAPIYGVMDLERTIQSAIDAYAMRSNFRR
jgi:hypothetical protein